MKILALETSETAGSVAAFEDGNLLAQLDLNPQQRSAQSLAPALAELLDRLGWRPGGLGLVAVGIGPGSFTGLRVGVTAAKVLAYAGGADILGISTLEAIAAQVPVEVPRLSVALDAQRGQVAAQGFHRPLGGPLAADGPWQLLDADAWLSGLSPGTAVAGPVLRKLASRVPSQAVTLEPRYWHPTAEWIGRLALEARAAGRRDSVWSLLPVYSRRSAAEEKRAGPG